MSWFMRAVPGPDPGDHAHVPHQASVSSAVPGSARADEIEEIWRDVLGITEIDRNEDFFALGGTSISALLKRAGAL